MLGVRSGDAAGVRTASTRCAQLHVDGLDAAEVEVLGVAGGLVAHRERPRGVEGGRVEGTDGILCKLWRRGEVLLEVAVRELGVAEAPRRGAGAWWEVLLIVLVAKE